jgi:hypothetical protein
VLRLLAAGWGEHAMTLANVTAASFAGHLLDGFGLATPAGTIPLVLTEVEMLGPAGGNRDAFTLLFLGPARPILPQAIYRLEHPALGRLEIFLVPLGPRDGGMRYEAVFS